MTFFKKAAFTAWTCSQIACFQSLGSLRTCDSTNAENCRAWIEAHPELAFDIIVDDASHWNEQQPATLRQLFPLVKPGGYYVIEDVVPDSLVSRELQRVHEIVGDVGIFYAGLKNNLCVIHKVPLHCCREHS